MEGYEYQRYQVGASPFAIPLRFPGQYFDVETNLIENWNRYYDASTGRYLQPEPVLQKPNFVAARALLGMSTPAYAYASNNPVNRYDPNGQWDMGGVRPPPGAGGVVIAVGGGLVISAATIALICATTGDYYDFCKFWFPKKKPEPNKCEDTPKPQQPPPPQKPECYAQYLKDTAECGSRYTDDVQYERCMAQAWKNYIRCLNGLPWEPMR